MSQPSPRYSPKRSLTPSPSIPSKLAPPVAFPKGEGSDYFQEARSKRQEARGKRQEARGKKQEARGKRQEICQEH